MRWMRRANWAALVMACVLVCGLTGCNGVNTPGQMEWVTPTTKAPRVGVVYCIRGWQGVYSAGIDEMARQLNAQGVTAYVYMPEQYPELAATMVERLKNVPHEPICFIGHSRGCDSSLIISRELDKVNVTVDLIVTMDSVDEKTVPKNVKVVHNYWMPGVLGGNLLRGIPLTPEPGFTGVIHNYNLDTEYRSWRGDWSDHITMDDDAGLQARIVQNVLDVCPERSKWVQPPVTPAPATTRAASATARNGSR